MSSDQPTERQVLGAKIRAAAEEWEEKHRQKFHAGGWILPPMEVRNGHLASRFGMTPREISRFMTWSRNCTHPWSEGACPRCPE